MKAIILKQPVLFGITDQEALVASAREQSTSIIEVDTKTLANEATESGDWLGVAAEVVRQYKEKLAPSVDPSTIILYFGTAPIPPAMLLGYLVGTWPKVEPYLRHHARRTWDWVPPTSDESKLAVVYSSKEIQPITGDAIVRVSTSFFVNPDDSHQIVPEPILEVDIKLEPSGVDVVTSPRLLEETAEAFGHALNEIERLRPRVKNVHVFAAVPVGLAFSMGTRVTSTYHPLVHTYYFKRDSTPRNLPAIILQKAAAARPLLAPESADILKAERAIAVEEVKKISTMAEHCAEDATKTKNKAFAWISFVLQKSEQAFFQGNWKSLPLISTTTLRGTKLDSSKDTPLGFRYDDREQAWVLGGGLLSAIYRGLPDETRRRRLYRMLFLHEGAHDSHRLTSTTSNQIGRFPKLLEEIDYQADVWAMLHEYKRARLEDHEATKQVRPFFLELLDTALEGLWAFDAGVGDMERIEIRRLNRYLIWYWQYLRIERRRDALGVLEILATKPLIELTGPKQSSEGRRVYFELDANSSQNLELGVLHQNTVQRLGATMALDLHSLLQAFRHRNSSQIKEILRGACEQLAA